MDRNRLLGIVAKSSVVPQRACTVMGQNRIEIDGWMDGWMTCDFTSFSTVFQSYQDDGRLKMKGCVQWNSVDG